MHDITNYLFVLSILYRSDSGIAIVSATSAREAFTVLQRQGVYNGNPNDYILVQSKNIGMYKQERVTLVYESYTNALVAYDAIVSVMEDLHLESPIEHIKVNGTELEIDDKTVNITVPTALADLTPDVSHRTVTDIEKSIWNNKADASAIPDVSGKADRVQSAVAGHIATLDSSGNLVDSGKGISDINPLWGNIQGSIENQTDLMSALSGKQDTIADLSNIRAGAAAGATAYQKPQTGIPASDLASAVQTTLEKVEGIEAGAQVNTVERLVINGDVLTPDSDKSIVILLKTLASQVLNGSGDIVQGPFTIVPTSLLCAAKSLNFTAIIFNVSREIVGLWVCKSGNDNSDKFYRVLSTSNAKCYKSSNYHVFDAANPGNYYALVISASGSVTFTTENVSSGDRTEQTAITIADRGYVDTAVAAKYTKPASGIPASDLADGVIPDISGKADAATTLAGYGITDAYTKTEVDSKVASTYKPAGSVANVGSLGSLTSANLGKVYNFTASFTTTSDFVEGSGKTYPVGTNVVIVDVGTAQSPSYKYDVLAGFVDLSGYYQLPSGGIPSTDLASAVQTSLGKADTALQSFTETDPTVPSWAKASSKPSYDYSEISNTPTLPDVTGKADKVSSATNGNFAALDANGNLTDSGHKHSDYLTSHQDITGKADKVSGATNGHLAALDSNGNLTDSGKSASDFQPTIDSSHKLAASLVSGLASVATSGSYNDLSNKPDEVEANPTVPSGTTPTDLTGLKVGSSYYSVPSGGSVSALSNNDIDSIWNTAMA